MTDSARWAAAARDYANGAALDTEQHMSEALIALEMADLCEKRNLVPANGLEADVFGFGNVPVMFTHATRPNWWCALHELVEPLAIPIQALEALHFNDQTQGGQHSDALKVLHAGKTHLLRLVDSVFVVNTLATASPWAKTFLANLAAGKTGGGVGGALGSIGGGSC